LVFDNAGLCGGYPAPTARYTYTVSDANMVKRAREHLPLPHVEGDPTQPDVTKYLEGRFDVELGFYHRALKEGDVVQSVLQHFRWSWRSYRARY
jgi:hypothetical protein